MARSRRVLPLKRTNSGVRVHHREEFDEIVHDEAADSDIGQVVDSFNDESSRRLGHHIVRLTTPKHRSVSDYIEKLLVGSTSFAADMAVVGVQQASSSETTAEAACHDLERFKENPSHRGHGIVFIEMEEGPTLSDGQQKRLEKVTAFIGQLGLPTAVVEPAAEVIATPQPAITLSPEAPTSQQTAVAL